MDILSCHFSATSHSLRLLQPGLCVLSLTPKFFPICFFSESKYRQLWYNRKEKPQRFMPKENMWRHCASDLPPLDSTKATQSSIAFPSHSLILVFIMHFLSDWPDFSRHAPWLSLSKFVHIYRIKISPSLSVVATITATAAVSHLKPARLLSRYCLFLRLPSCVPVWWVSYPTKICSAKPRQLQYY